MFQPIARVGGSHRELAAVDGRGQVALCVDLRSASTAGQANWGHECILPVSSLPILLQKRAPVEHAQEFVRKPGHTGDQPTDAELSPSKRQIVVFVG